VFPREVFSLSILENTKEIAELVKKLGNIDLYRKIVELEGEIIEVSRQKLQLEQKVDQLEKSVRVRVQMRFKAPLYYQESDNIPFCPTCFEKDGLATHLLDYGIFNSAQKGPRGQWYCMCCENTFYADSAQN
jgi:hypothetical protein